MNKNQAPVSFKSNAANALNNPSLRIAMRNITSTFGKKRVDAIGDKPFEEWRERASEIRMDVLNNIGDYVDMFSKNATKAGAVVHRAKDSSIACDIVASLLKDYGADKVVKSKSMISEEIHLNAYLEKEGIKVVETDLGEYIIQIAGETPSHIIVPAIHKSRQQVGQLFCEKLGCEFTDDPTTLTKTAKKILREEFITAPASISGSNFAIAETGSISLVTNEGNGRMVTTLPPLHIAITAIEKILPKLSDLALFLRLLPRSATGQVLTSYFSLITGVRKEADSTGAKHLHIVLLDNGRSEIVKSDCKEILKCIRCGACMNVCPVYGIIGGHAYDSTYPGPMGVILSAVLNGLERAHPLLDASTLCGACSDVCPVKVPLAKLINRLREIKVENGLAPELESIGMWGFGAAAKHPKLFELGQKAANAAWPIARLLDKQTVDRLPKPVQFSFKRRVL